MDSDLKEFIKFTEGDMYKSEIEQIALNILRDENGYAVFYGPDISEGEQKEREYTEVVLQNRLRDAIDRINPMSFLQRFRECPAIALLWNYSNNIVGIEVLNCIKRIRTKFFRLSRRLKKCWYELHSAA